MPTVKELLQSKSGPMLTTTPDVTVLAASILMNDRGTGSVLIMENDRLIGIFTERDLMRRVVAMVKDPASTPLRDVMTRELVTCTPEASVSDCGTLMSERRIRHLPVVSGHTVVGVITTGDLLAHELKEKDAVIQQLESFVFYVRQ